MTFSAFRESEKQGWDARAQGYADATARATLQSVPALLTHGQFGYGATVLDAGCGPGFVAGCASLLGAKAQGIDFAPSMVREAQKRFPEIPFTEGDVEDIAFDDEQFDAVLSNIVLFHVTDPARAMTEAFRVLRPSGRFAFSQWLGPDQSPCYKIIFDAVGPHADMSLGDPAPNAYALSDRDNVSRMLTGIGFEDVRFEVIENVLSVEADSFFEFFMTFGVRVPLILAQQTEAVRETIRAMLDDSAEAYRDGKTYAIPMPSLIVSARKP